MHEIDAYWRQCVYMYIHTFILRKTTQRVSIKFGYGGEGSYAELWRGNFSFRIVAHLHISTQK
jgi:hypothetical protein